MRPLHFSVKVLSACGCAVATLIAAAASAQTAAPPPASTDEQSNGVTEIVVTAQKREQNQQDVPISMTAVTAQALVANRITNVLDLGSVVPNLAVRSAGGGSQLPAFSMRGITSYGVVPGADKELSTYIDGVYIASTVGSALDLPDIARIEVLRGPQGTLFGRNATVGAISVVTRNPPDKFGLNQEFSVGNYNQFRSKTRVDFGSFGDFSATATFVHDERRGDVLNLGAGTIFHYPASAGIPTTQVSPKYLGDRNENIIFAALKYEPNGDFKIIEKFDWTGNHYTPAAVAAVGTDFDTFGPVGGAFYNGFLALQSTPPVFDTTGQRPSAVNNSFTLPSYGRNWGDSVTAEYRATDNLSFKNIVAYRESYLRASEDITGLGGLVVTPAISAAFGYPASYIGSPFVVLGVEQVTTSNQWSEELQANYNSSFLTLTAGGLYFHLKTQSGGAPGLPNDVVLSVLPGGNVSGTQSTAYNKGTSIAGYVQAEVHILPKLDLVGGFRLTKDNKSGALVTGAVTTDFTYSKAEPSFAVGVNYKPTRDTLLYGKYSTAFVSGGAAGPIVFKPEKAKSWEVGAKTEWFDHRLRANVALFDVKYTDIQQPVAGPNFGYPEIGLAIGDQGNGHAKGVEIETTAVPIKGVSLSAAGGYTHMQFTSITPFFSTAGAALGVPLNLSNYVPALTPNWTANLAAEYDTPAVFDEARLTFRVDASWRSRENTNSDLAYNTLPQYDSIQYSPATWLVNTRIALEDFRLPAGRGTVAFWTKNLTNAKEQVFPDNVSGFAAGTEFQAARTIGVDFSFTY